MLGDTNTKHACQLFKILVIGSTISYEYVIGKLFLGQNTHQNFYQMRQNSIVSFFSIIIIKLLNIIFDSINLLKVSDIKGHFLKMTSFFFSKS